ncbi:hypothetical protein NGRA_1696 [Nosema granulosis]|uniref:Uncharacterized protein n=1 Tax=Nosema granulosis TaxID=83296 RepID=A0A9P6GXZ5_9MICR|nr:hypothetical protein NGRA_1696 [Nosema granulosis]
MENESRAFLLKRLGKALTVRDALKKTIRQLDDDFEHVESHIRALFPLLRKTKTVSQSQTEIPFVAPPSKHITNFPFFARNSKYILALYNTGVPVKCVIAKPNPLVLYTAGYHSKRLFFKHKFHPKMDDNYIFYTCSTRMVNNRLMFEIKTDDGLYILDNKLGAHETMIGLFNGNYEFEDIEDFFGISSREFIDFLKQRFEN